MEACLLLLVSLLLMWKSITLIQNCQGLTLGEEKFSSLMSSSVAAARRPTTAGRRPAKALCTGRVFM